MSLIHIPGTQDKEAMLELAKLEEPLHFKKTSIGIVVGHDVKDYLGKLSSVSVERRAEFGEHNILNFFEYF